MGRFRSRDPYEAEDQQVVVIDVLSEELLAVCYHEYGGPVGPASRLSIGWSEYLDHLTERLESGSLEASTDTYGVLRLDAAVRPPIAPIERRPDPAEALVATLVAQDLLRLRPGPAEELLEKVRRALRKRGSAARAAGLVAIFSELDVVEDFFISEDELAALLEQF